MLKQLFFGCVLGLVLVGCSSGPSLVGKWQGDLAANGQTIPATIEYKADNTWVANASVQSVGFQITGTYELKDGKLSQTTKETKLTGELPPQLAPMKAQMEAAMAQGNGQTSTTEVKFVDADTVTTKTAAGQDVTLKRVKE